MPMQRTKLLEDFVKDRKRKIIRSTNNCKHYIKEAMVKAMDCPLLIYLPYSESLNCFISSFCELLTEKKEIVGKLVIAVEDMCIEDKMAVFSERLGQVIGTSDDLVRGESYGVFVLTHKDLKTMQNNAMDSSGGIKADVSAILFDDIKSIGQILDITKTFESIISRFEIKIALTSSPFLFYDYFKSRYESKIFKCYTPVLYDKDTSDYYKKIVETGEVIYYKEWQDEVGTDASTEELLGYLGDEHPGADGKEILRFFLKNNIYDSKYIARSSRVPLTKADRRRVDEMGYRSEKLSVFFKILEQQSGQKTCILFSDTATRDIVYDMVLGMTDNLSTKATSPNIADNVYGLATIMGRLSGEEIGILNLAFYSWEAKGLKTRDFDEFIFFDYFPMYSAKKRYLLAPIAMRRFFQALLAVEQRIELEIKPYLEYSDELVGIKSTEMGQVVEYKIIDGSRRLSEIKQISYRKKMVRKVVQRCNDVFLTVDSDKSIASTSSYLSKVYSSPISTRNPHFVSEEMMFPYVSVEFGVVSSLMTFANPRSFTGTGYCDFMKRSLVLYMFNRDKNMRIKFHSSAIDGYIICDKRGTMVDVYFCLKIYPKIYFSDPSKHIANGLHGLKHKSYTAQGDFFDSIDWKRCSIREASFVKERFDVKATFDLGRDLELGTLRRLFERKWVESTGARNRSAGANLGNRSPGSTISEDHFFPDGELDDRFDPLDTFSDILSRFRGSALVFSSLKRSEFTLMSCEEILEHLKSLEFSDFYYFLCLLSKRQRYISNQVSRSHLERMVRFKARNFCLYLYSKLSHRFMDISSLIDEYRDGSSLSAPSGIEIRRVVITPLGFVFNFPKISETNRVLREFDSDKFLRIGLREETIKDKMKQDSSKELDGVYSFYRDLLCDGLFLGKRKYFFLAMTTSQMKLHSTWFMTPYFHNDVLIGPDYIRSWLGDFSEIKNIGKYAIRLGQAFSSTTDTVRVTDFVEVEDIERNGYVFTDGIGMISYSLAEEISFVLNLADVPSAFQIRFAGYKGVVAVHPWLENLGGRYMYDEHFGGFMRRCGDVLCKNKVVQSLRGSIDNARLVLRPSMKKFESTHKSVEIVTQSSSMPFHLNRQVILILEALGVEEEVFFTLQDQVIEDFLCELSTDFSGLIKKHCSLVSFKSASTHHVFYRKFLTPLTNKLVKDLCRKSKIFVPKGRSLMGVIDELGVLKEGEIFVMVKKELTDTCMEGNEYIDYGKHIVISSKAFVAKNPCLHPGDVRVVRCVDRQELHYLKDVVVFSKEGCRPVQNMCSGSDLDGDIFLVSWDARLIPKKLFEPDIYTSDTFLNKEIVSINDIVNFYIRYMKSFNLGLIANSHLAFSDSKGILAPESLKLALIFNKSVDFPKTGFLARVPESLIPEKYPDFMECRYNTYVSRNILGKLYRRVLCLVMSDVPGCECRRCLEKHMLLFSSIVKVMVKGSFVTSRTVSHGKMEGPDCTSVFNQYKSDIHAIMAKYGFRTEEEAFMGICDDDDAGSAFQDLKELVRKYKQLGRKYEDDVPTKLCPSNDCDESITSFPWIFLGNGEMEASKRIEKMFCDNVYGNFMLNKKIVLVEKDKENHRSRTDIIGSSQGNEDIHRTEYLHDGFIRAYCSMKRYHRFEDEIPRSLRPHICEAFNLLLIMNFFPLDSFDDVFDFFSLLLSILEGSSKFHVSKALLKLSSILPEDPDAKSRFPFLGAMDNEQLGTNLLLTAFLLCFDINFVYKVSIVLKYLRASENSSTRKTRKPKRVNRIYDLVVMGMFDSSDEVYLEPYNGPSCPVHSASRLFVPVLLNRGICRIENYRDICYDFFHKIFVSECLGRGMDIESPPEMMLFSVQIVPGRFYLFNVSSRFINNTVTIDELCTALVTSKKKGEDGVSAGVSYFMNNVHPLIDTETRDGFVETAGIVFNEKIEEIYLTLLYDSERYRLVLNVESGRYKIKRITKGRKIVGKTFLLGVAEWESNRDIMIEMISEEIIYEQGYSNLQGDETRLLRDDIITMTNNMVEVNGMVSGYKEARVEVDVSIEMVGDSSIRLSHKQVYRTMSGESCLKLYQKKVFVSTLGRIHSKNIVSTGCLEKYFERYWKSIVSYYC